MLFTYELIFYAKPSILAKYFNRVVTNVRFGYFIKCDTENYKMQNHAYKNILLDFKWL